MASPVCHSGLLHATKVLPEGHPDRIATVTEFGQFLLEHDELIDPELAEAVLSEYLARVREEHPEDTELITSLEDAIDRCGPGGP